MRAFRVLLVERDPMLLAACRTVLVGQAVDLIAVTTADECLACLLRTPPDLMIVDPELPGLVLNDILLQPTQDDGQAQPLVIFTVQPDRVPGQVANHPGVRLLLGPVTPALLAQIIGAVAQAAPMPLVEVDA
jgi:DNA-binding response OmpR family regulator